MEKDALVLLVPKVLRFFVNKVGNPSDADDCAQRTLERVLHKAKDEEIRSWSAYALGVARNVLREYWREIAKKNQVASIESDDNDFGGISLAQLGAGVSTIINAGQWQRLIADALRTLRLDYQTVLELYFWENMRHREIAEIMEIPPGTVGTWLRRGKAEVEERLQQVAQQEGLEPIDSRELERRLREIGEANISKA